MDFTNENKKYYVEEGTVEFLNNNLLILTTTIKELSNANKDFIDSLILEAEKKFKDNIGVYNNANWDSMSHLEILLSLEKKFKIKFTQLEISKLDSYLNIIRIIDKKVN